MKQSIQYISTEKLDGHPDNPRKDLGDLTELADSIKENGIMQNLTVVPWFSAITGKGADDPKQQEELGYRVVIGHRRLSAAKIAGLTEVPCVIADMDKKQQVATMLLENMQRNDLTILEQAHGIQMMMDFGSTLSEISKKTGLSDSTLRHRRNLLKLDENKLIESIGHGANITDYIKLEEIKDIKIRNDVLKYIGTSDFNWKLKNAIEDDEFLETLANILEDIKSYAEPTEGFKRGRYAYSEFFKWNYKNYERPEDADREEYCYFVQKDGRNVFLWKKAQEKAADNDDDDKNEKRQHMEQRKEQLQAVSNCAYELRKEFVKNYHPKSSDLPIIVSQLVKRVWDYSLWIDEDIVLEFLGIDTDDEGVEYEKIESDVLKSPLRYLFITITVSGDSEREKYFDWYGKHNENRDLNSFYSFICQLGYEMSEEEKQLQDGTHPLFMEEEK